MGKVPISMITVRAETWLHDSLVRLAKARQTSLNKLMVGLARTAVEEAPEFDAATEQKLAKLAAGTPVFYSPAPGHEFRGTVFEAPRELGDGTWVVRIVDLEAAYGRFVGLKGMESTQVRAAHVSCLRVVE